MEERDLVAQAKHSPEAFGQLYQRYVKRIYNYHYRHTSSVSDAEDLTSRTFYRALKAIKRYKDKGYSFQAWLFRIAHNLVVNWYRDTGRRQMVPLDNIQPLHADGPLPYDSVELAEEKAELQKIIGALPEDRKTLVILKFVERMSNAEIAAAMGRTEGAIKALYHRTLVSMRKKMQKGGSDEA